MSAADIRPFRPQERQSTAEGLERDARMGFEHKMPRDTGHGFQCGEVNQPLAGREVVVAAARIVQMETDGTQR